MPGTLHLINDLKAFEACRDEWISFSDSCPLAAPFCGPRVWMPWLKAHPHFEPAVFEWRKGGDLLALIPMCRKGTRLEMATSLHLDYQDVAATDLDAAVAAVRAILQFESDDSSALVFPQVAARSRLAAALASPELAGFCHQEGRFWSRCPVASLDLGRDSFDTALPARQRKDYRNAGNRLARAFPDHHVEHHGPGGFDPALLDDAAAQHRENQYRKEGESVFANPAYAAFLKEQLAAGAPLCLSTVREKEGGPLIAFNLGYLGRATFYYYLTSYSGQHASLSPGRWLLVDSLRHWSERIEGSILRFDMLCGEEDYKFRWATASYLVSRVVMIPRRLTNLPRILAYSTVYGLKNAKHRLLARTDGSRRIDVEPEDLVLPS